MKTNTLLILFTAFILHSCGTQFTCPHPIGARNLQKFPRKMRGVYVNDSVHCQLTVTKTKLNFEEIKPNDDTNFAEIEPELTFEIGENELLRKGFGYYFLNKKNKNDYWDIKMISFEKGQLTYAIPFDTTQQQVAAVDQADSSAITIDEVVEDTETQVTIDTTESQIKTLDFNKTQFEQFVRDGGFNHKVRLIKISNKENKKAAR
jgi:hypothetical protein